LDFGFPDVLILRSRSNQRLRVSSVQDPESKLSKEFGADNLSKIEMSGNPKSKIV
jgi:hypothetical protein